MISSTHKHLIYDQLDVGQGDAAVIGLFNDEDECVLGIVIDGGPKPESVKTILARLEYHKIKKVHLVILTHYDSDHLNGVYIIARCLNMKQKPDGNYPAPPNLSQDMIKQINEYFSEAYFIDPGTPLQQTQLAKKYNFCFASGNNLFNRRIHEEEKKKEEDEFVGKDILGYLPSTSWTPNDEIQLRCIARNGFYLTDKDTQESLKLNLKKKNAHVHNARSLGFLIFYNQHMLYTAGDLTGDMEEKLAESLFKLYKGKVSMAKLSHHGSRTSTPKDFIASFGPQVTLCSHAKKNNHGLPNIDIIDQVAEESGRLSVLDRKPRRLMFTAYLDSATSSKGKSKGLPPFISGGVETALNSQGEERKERNDKYLLTKMNDQYNFCLEVCAGIQPGITNPSTTEAKRHINSRFEFKSDVFEFTTMREQFPYRRVLLNKKRKFGEIGLEPERPRVKCEKVLEKINLQEMKIEEQRFLLSDYNTLLQGAIKKLEDLKVMKLTHLESTEVTFAEAIVGKLNQSESEAGEVAYFENSPLILSGSNPMSHYEQYYLALIEHNSPDSKVPLTSVFPTNRSVSSKLIAYQKFKSLESFMGLSSGFQIEKHRSGELTVTSNLPYRFGHKALDAQKLSVTLTDNKIVSGSLQLGSLKLQLIPPIDSITDETLSFQNISVRLGDLGPFLEGHSLYEHLKNTKNELYHSIVTNLEGTLKAQSVLQLEIKPFDNKFAAEIRVGFLLLTEPHTTLGDTTLRLSGVALALNTSYERSFEEITVIGGETKKNEYFSLVRYANLAGSITLSRNGKSLKGGFVVRISPQDQVLFEITSKEDSLSINNILDFLNIHNEFKEVTKNLGLDADISVQNIMAIAKLGSEHSSFELFEINLNVSLSSTSNSVYKFFDKTNFGLQMKWKKGGEISFMCSLSKGVISFASVLKDFDKLKELGFGDLKITEFSIGTTNNLDFVVSFAAEDIFDFTLFGIKFSISRVSASIEHSKSGKSYEVSLVASVGEFLCEITFSYEEEEWVFTVDVKDINAPGEFVDFFNQKQFPFNSDEFQVAKFQPDLGSFLSKPDNYFLLSEALLELKFSTNPSMSVSSLDFKTWAEFSFEIPVIETLVKSSGYLHINYDRSSQDKLTLELSADPLQISRGNTNLTGSFNLQLSKTFKKASITLQDVELFHVIQPNMDEYMLNWSKILADWKLYLNKVEVSSDREKGIWGVACQLNLMKADKTRSNLISLSFDRIVLQGLEKGLTKLSASCKEDSHHELAGLLLNDSLPQELQEPGFSFKDANITMLQSSFIGFKISISGFLELLDLGSFKISLGDFSLEAVKISNKDNFNKYLNQIQSEDERYIRNLQQAAGAQEMGKINLALTSDVKIGSLWFQINVFIFESQHWKIEGFNKAPINLLEFLREHEIDLPEEVNRIVKPFANITKVAISISKVAGKTKDKASETLGMEIKDQIDCSLQFYRGDDSKIGIQLEIKEDSKEITDQDFKDVMQVLGIEQLSLTWISKNSTTLKIKSGIDMGVMIDLNKDWLTYVRDAIKLFNKKFDGNLALKWNPSTRSLTTNIFSNLTINLGLLVISVDGIEFTKSSFGLSATLLIPHFKNFVMAGGIREEYAKKDLVLGFSMQGVDIRILPGLLIKTIDCSLKMSNPIPSFGATGLIGDNGTFEVSVSPVPPYQFHFKLVNFVVSFSSLMKVFFGASTPEALDVVIIQPPQGKNIIELTYGGPLDIAVMVGLAIFHKRILDISLQVGVSGIHVLAVVESIELQEWMKIKRTELKLDINPLKLAEAHFSLKGGFTILGLSIDASIDLSTDGLFLSTSQALDLGFFKSNVSFDLKITKEQFQLNSRFALRIDLGFGPINLGPCTIPYQNILGVGFEIALGINGFKMHLSFSVDFEVLGVGFSEAFNLDIDFCNIADIPWQIRNSILAKIPEILFKKIPEFIIAIGKKVISAVVSIAKTIWSFFFGFLPGTPVIPYKDGVDSLKNQEELLKTLAHFIQSTVGEPDALLIEGEIFDRSTTHKHIEAQQFFLWIDRDYPTYPERMYVFLKGVESFALVNKSNLKTEKEYVALSVEEKLYHDEMSALVKIVTGVLYLEDKLSVLEPSDPIGEAEALFKDSLNYSKGFPEAYFGLFMVDVLLGNALPNDKTNPNLKLALELLTSFKNRGLKLSDFKDPHHHFDIRAKLITGILIFCDQNLKDQEYLSWFDFKGISQVAQVRNLRRNMLKNFDIKNGEQNKNEAVKAFEPFVNAEFEYVAFMQQYINVSKEAYYYIGYFSTNLESDQSSEYYQKALEASRSKKIPTFPAPYDQVQDVIGPRSELDRSIYFNLATTKTMFITEKHEGHDFSHDFCMTCTREAGEMYQLAIRFNGDYKVATNVKNEPSFTPFGEQEYPTFEKASQTLKLIEDQVLARRKEKDPLKIKNKVTQKDLDFVGSVYDKVSVTLELLKEWSPVICSKLKQDDKFDKKIFENCQTLLATCLKRMLAVLTLYGVPTYSWVYLSQYKLNARERQTIYNKTKEHPNSAFELACILFNSEDKSASKAQQAQDLAHGFLDIRKAVLDIMADDQAKVAHWKFDEVVLDMNLINSDNIQLCDDMHSLVTEDPSRFQNTFTVMMAAFPELGFIDNLHYFISGASLKGQIPVLQVYMGSFNLMKDFIREKGRGILEQVLQKNSLPTENTFNLNIQSLQTLDQKDDDFPVAQDFKIRKADFFGKLTLQTQYKVEIIFHGLIQKAKSCNDPSLLFTKILGHLEEVKAKVSIPQEIVVPEEYMNDYAQFTLECGVHAFIYKEVCQNDE